MPTNYKSSLSEVEPNTGAVSGVVIVDPEYDAIEIESDELSATELTEAIRSREVPKKKKTKKEGKSKVSKTKSRADKMRALRDLRKTTEEPEVEEVVEVAEPEPAAPSPEVAQQLIDMQEQLAVLSDLALANVEAEPEPEPEIPAETEEDLEAKAVQVVKESFDGLKIPGLSPLPQRPTFRVEFDLGQAGKHQAWYHWVSEHNGGLFLVYDNRFEFGSKYSPPDMGNEPIKVRLPDHNTNYTVYSTDFVHPLGVFEITNLVIAEGSDDGIMDNVMPEEPFIGFGG